MTNDELSRKVAEVMGWKLVHTCLGYRMTIGGAEPLEDSDFAFGYTSKNAAWEDIPSYATDATSILAAVREKGLRIVEAMCGARGRADVELEDDLYNRFAGMDLDTHNAFERALCKALLAACGEGGGE